MIEVKEPVVMPVCPFCKTTMMPKYFSGYYESFPMWECECEEIPGADGISGSYA
jgi:hypothetical protein